jgi:transposase
MSYFLVIVIVYVYICLTMRYISLKTEELEALELLYKNSNDNLVRKRSQCLLLSNQRQSITALSKIFGVNRRTIERWYDGWAQSGLQSLQMVPGRGVKTRLRGHEDEVKKQVEIHGRNLKNVLNYFQETHNITICKKTLQNFLKGTGLYLETNQVVSKDQTEPR